MYLGTSVRIVRGEKRYRQQLCVRTQHCGKADVDNLWKMWISSAKWPDISIFYIFDCGKPCESCAWIYRFRSAA